MYMYTVCEWHIEYLTYNVFKLILLNSNGIYINVNDVYLLLKPKIVDYNRN